MKKQFLCQIFIVLFFNRAVFYYQPRFIASKTLSFLLASHQANNYYYNFTIPMGNQQELPQATSTQGQKIVLRLRNRDIILHYGFKFKVVISDLDMFPHELQGLRLWDIDIIAARYAILQSQKFKGKDVLAFKAGVGITAVALGKWTDAKNIALCDVREEVVRNGVKNCLNNGVNGIISFKLTPQDVQRMTAKYDYIICPDLIASGFIPKQIPALFRSLLKEGGQAVIIMPQKKEQARKLLQVIDRKEFKITNLILTAEQYETSPLYNRLESEKQFPLIGKTNFYAIGFQKLPQKPVSTSIQVNGDKPHEEINGSAPKIEVESIQIKEKQIQEPKEALAKTAEQQNNDQL